MPTKFRDATPSERLIVIGSGLFLAFIFAAVLGFIAPFIFQWGAGFFDPNPNVPPPCDIREFMDRSLNDFMECRENSDHFEDHMRRLSQDIPWFWITFLPLAWLFTRQAWRGRIRDDREDVSYPGQLAWDFVLTVLFQIFFYIAIWAFLARSPAAFIALASIILAFMGWGALNKWFLGRYGQTKAERESS